PCAGLLRALGETVPEIRGSEPGRAPPLLSPPCVTLRRAPIARLLPAPRLLRALGVLLRSSLRLPRVPAARSRPWLRLLHARGETVPAIPGCGPWIGLPLLREPREPCARPLRSLRPLLARGAPAPAIPGSEPWSAPLPPRAPCAGRPRAPCLPVLRVCGQRPPLAPSVQPPRVRRTPRAPCSSPLPALSSPLPGGPALRHPLLRSARARDSRPPPWREQPLRPSLGLVRPPLRRLSH